MAFSGHYLDGADHEEAVYFWNEGTVWRRDVWSEGELLSTWLNPEVLTLSADEHEQRGAVSVGDDVGSPIICGPGDSRSLCRPAPPNPVRTLRYTDGRRRARGGVSGGERTGPWTFWYRSGAVARRAEFLGGSLSGPYQEWYENGRPSIEGEYSLGTKIGAWRYWTESGTIRRQHYGR
jgi:hypothetical protein